MMLLAVYDVTNRASFDNIIMWLNELEVYAGPNIVKVRGCDYP